MATNDGWWVLTTHRATGRVRIANGIVVETEPVFSHFTGYRLSKLWKYYELRKEPDNG